MTVIIYTTPNCPNCHKQMDQWDKDHVAYIEKHIQELLDDGALLTDYRLDHNGNVPMMAPVIWDNGVWR